MVTCSADQSLILWEHSDAVGKSDKEKGGVWFQTSRLQTVHRGDVYSVDWSESLGLVASGAGDNAIALTRLLRADDGCRYMETLREFPACHDGDANCVRWAPRRAPDEAVFLLSTGDDGFLKIWTCELN
jgi:WD40 repeat protein